MFSPNCVVGLIAPEVCLKSDLVKVFIEKRLRDNAKLSLKNADVPITQILNLSNRMVFFSLEPEKVLKALSNCFGFHSLFLAQEFQFSSLDDLKLFSTQISEGKLRDTFAVRGKSYCKEFKSKKLEEELGSSILSSQPKLKVNLGSPKTELFCIAFQKKAFFYFESSKYAGGMPVGSQGVAGVLCESNDKNAVSLSWFLLRSGCRVVFVGETPNGSDSLTKWNNGEKIGCISLVEAKQRFSDNRIRAFFSSAESIKESEKASELVGLKVFSPFLFSKLEEHF